MLATGAPMANEVFVACIQPLQPGDENHAVSFAIPLATKGLRILSRKSYEAHAVSVFDNPLSSRFDENDALIYFDDVRVPWDRVFVYRDTDMCRAQFHDTPGHVFQTLLHIPQLALHSYPAQTIANKQNSKRSLGICSKIAIHKNRRMRPS